MNLGKNIKYNQVPARHTPGIFANGTIQKLEKDRIIMVSNRDFSFVEGLL